MTRKERNQALEYVASGSGDTPNYAAIRYLIENGLLEPDGATLTARGAEIVHAIGQVPLPKADDGEQP